MSWYDEQIKQRKQRDQALFENSIFRMASVVLGKHGAGEAAEKRIVAKAAIDAVLKYFRYQPVEVPDNVTDPDEQLEICLRPYGIMRRTVALEEGWYRDAFGPMLAVRKEDGLVVALLPKSFRGYWFVDPVTGEKRRLNRQTAGLFKRDAICFYRPLPQKKLRSADLLRYLKSCLRLYDLVPVLCLTLLATLVGMLIPTVTRALTGFVLDRGNCFLLVGAASFLVAATLSSLLIQAVRGLGVTRLSLKTSLSVEAAVMARMINLPPRFFRDYSSGELSSRFRAVSQLCTLLLGSGLSMGVTSLMSLLYLTQIARFTPALAAPALLILLVVFGVGLASALLQTRVTRQAMELGAKENGLGYALITGVQKLKLAGAEKRAFSRWATAYAETAELVYDPPLFLKVSGVITTGVSLAGNLVLYYLGVRSGAAPSEYIAFNAAFGTVMGAFTALTGVALNLAQIKPILDMAEPILEAEPESSERKAMVSRLSGGIELVNVRFRYNETMPYVVDGMSLKIKAGEYLAIVGASGCGKSTLLRLLMGFETPEKGAIYYDGRDMRNLDLRSLRRKIGSVTQDGTLFPGDIYSNIVISAPHLTLDEAWEAAELAGMAETIRAMPMGMHTIVSEGQGGISGGQKQRLMIARAVAPKPKILMFDEATSALDNVTQKQVSDALAGLKCTRIVVAHRLSTIRHCDRILVLDKGRIVEDGTYDELISRDGFFADLVARQRIETVERKGEETK